MSKAKAPEWMVDAAQAALVVLNRKEAQIVADAICQAIQDNPRVPTEEQIDEIMVKSHLDGLSNFGRRLLKNGIDIFQRRYMFRSEPEVPEDKLCAAIQITVAGSCDVRRCVREDGHGGEHEYGKASK